MEIIKIMRELIKKFKQNYDNGDSLNIEKDDTELLNKIDKFDNVLETMIETKPEDYYREIKNMILNEFEKSRYEIAQFLDNYKGKKANNLNDLFVLNLRMDSGKPECECLNNEEITQFIVSVSQICLFVLSNISFKLDLFNDEILHSKINLMFINIFVPYINENSQTSEYFSQLSSLLSAKIR